MTDHLGYDKHDPADRDGGNSRNGIRTKTVISEAVGAVEIDVPRDRDASFTPTIVKKRQRRLGDVDKIVLSLYGKGMTTGEISAHFAEIYGVSVSKDVVSTITDKVLEEQQAWTSRPLASHYVAVFVDAIHVKVRNGAVANRPFYAAIGVDLQGHRDVLGIWAGTPGAGESSKYWINILTELKNRGVADIFYLVCDGLKGMPESVNTVFDQTIVQTCVVHLIRNTFKYSSKRYWPEIARDIKPVYTAVNADAAAAAFEAFDEKWGQRYTAIGKLWRAAWDNFVPFLDLDIEVRHLLSTTNAIESLNARFRKGIDAGGHFPSEQAAMKVLYLAVRSLDPKGTGQQIFGRYSRTARRLGGHPDGRWRCPAASTSTRRRLAGHQPWPGSCRPRCEIPEAPGHGDTGGRNRRTAAHLPGWRRPRPPPNSARRHSRAATAISTLLSPWSPARTTAPETRKALPRIVAVWRWTARSSRSTRRSRRGVRIASSPRSACRSTRSARPGSPTASCSTRVASARTVCVVEVPSPTNSAA